MKGLFGEEIPDELPKKPRSPIQKYRASVRYRVAENKEESCRYCKHSIGIEYSKIYWKCSLYKITAGAGTDIRLKNTCIKFEKQMED